MFRAWCFTRPMSEGRGRRAAVENSETRIRNAKPIERSETLTSMRINRPEPTAAELHREAHGKVAEARAVLNELTLVLDQLSRAR